MPNSSPPPTDRKGRPDARSIKVKDGPWQVVVATAAGLGCQDHQGRGSVGRMLTELGEGSLTIRRARPAGPQSVTERVRRQIDLDPLATSRAIADQLGLSVAQVSRIRSLYKKAQGEATDAKQAPAGASDGGLPGDPGR